jgi:hypothetical protein
MHAAAVTAANSAISTSRLVMTQPVHGCSWASIGVALLLLLLLLLLQAA